MTPTQRAGQLLGRIRAAVRRAKDQATANRERRLATWGDRLTPTRQTIVAPRTIIGRDGKPIPAATRADRRRRRGRHDRPRTRWSPRPDGGQYGDAATGRVERPSARRKRRRGEQRARAATDPTRTRVSP